eukprot:SAG11_NODE_18794_length_481_cov_0.806283_1_plen_80_part_10
MRVDAQTATERRPPHPIACSCSCGKRSTEVCVTRVMLALPATNRQQWASANFARKPQGTGARHAKFVEWQHTLAFIRHVR